MGYSKEMNLRFAEAVNTINDALPDDHFMKDNLAEIRKRFIKDYEADLGERIRKHTEEYFKKNPMSDDVKLRHFKIEPTD